MGRGELVSTEKAMYSLSGKRQGYSWLYKSLIENDSYIVLTINSMVVIM